MNEAKEANKLYNDYCKVDSEIDYVSGIALEDIQPDYNDAGKDDIQPDCDDVNANITDFKPATKLGKQAKKDM